LIPANIKSKLIVNGFNNIFNQFFFEKSFFASIFFEWRMLTFFKDFFLPFV